MTLYTNFIKSILTIILSIIFVIASKPLLAKSGKDSVGIYNAFEIQVPISQSGIKNVWDFPVSAALTSPSQHQVIIGGFYHSTDLWVVRFVPDELGEWTYAVNYAGGSQSGSFTCVESNNRGFILKHPKNPKRLIYSADGGLYSGVGFDDCLGATNGSILDAGPMDGGFRPPKGTNGIKDIGWSVPYIQYLIAYGDAGGFNLYRYSDANCQYSIIQNIAASGNNYDTLHSLWTDTLFYALREHGFRIFMTILASPRGNSSDTAIMAAVNRYAQYCINRYGALVDFWELTNESNPDSLWIAIVADYIHAHDSYHHLVSMSNEKPTHPSIDIISPHWYGKEADNESDIAVDQWHLQPFRQYPKPVIFGEQGDGTYWDSTSAMRMRGRLWSAFFNEGIIDFWNTSFAKDCNCNIYLGWDNRRYVRALQNFTSLIDRAAVRESIPLNPSSSFRAYGLISNQMEAVYIRNSKDEKQNNSGVQVTVNPPQNCFATWYNVHNGHIISSHSVSVGQQSLTAPDFISDIALFLGHTITPFPDLFTIDLSSRTGEMFKVPVGSADTVKFSVYNKGADSVQITDVILHGNWVQFFDLVKPLPIGLTLKPGDSTQIGVIYHPTDISDTGTAMVSVVHTASPAWDNFAVAGEPSLPSAVFTQPPLTDYFNIYPNPSFDFIKIEFGLKEQSNSEIEIYNIIGYPVYKKYVVEQNPGSYTENINLTSLPTGYYFVKLISSDKITIKSFLLLK